MTIGPLVSFLLFNMFIVVVICDLVHGMDTLHCQCLLTTAYRNLLLSMSDALETAAIYSFPVITYIQVSEKIYSCC